MGQTQSTSQLVNKSISSAVISNTQSCSASVVNAININFDQINGDFNLTDTILDQSITLNLNCLQTSDNNVQIQNDIKSNLKQELASAGFWNTVPTSSGDIINNIGNNIDINSIKKCLASQISTVEITAKTVNGNVNIKNLNINQVSNIITKCVQNDTNVASEITKLDSLITQTNQTDILSVIFIILGVITVITVIYIIYSSMGSKKVDLTSSTPWNENSITATRWNDNPAYEAPEEVLSKTGTFPRGFGRLVTKIKNAFKKDDSYEQLL
jgi:hypothetical protein